MPQHSNKQIETRSLWEKYIEKYKPGLFGKGFPNVGRWGGWFPTKSKSPRQSPFWPEVQLSFSQISQKTLGWVGGFAHLGKLSQIKPFFFGISFPNLFTHPPTSGFFVRFGKTKGEIWVEKGDYRGNLVFFCGVWTLFGNQPPHPHLGEISQKKRFS